ncbi:VTT domain-containing protein [Halopenitus sp. POP-27]|uniref:TVP38/TMEM64 family protein n=1 Tax=Halopenitus sp. POP-27 TaxID=2994425 RepID=UPI00246903C4|nr:VTT domain-containing protein [Halopenitus sp. POP-27]
MKRRLAAGLAVSAGLAAIVWLAGPRTLVTPVERVADDPALFAIALCGLAIVRPALALPTTLIAVAAGYGYGWAGVPAGIALVTVTALPPYALARAGWDPSGNRFSRAGVRLVAAAGATRTIAASWLLPVPSDAVSVVAGFTRVDVRPFLLGTAIGETPWVVAGVAVGVSADRLLAGGGVTFDPVLLLGLAGVAILLLAGPCYRVYTDRSDPEAGFV